MIGYDARIWGQVGSSGLPASPSSSLSILGSTRAARILPSRPPNLTAVGKILKLAARHKIPAMYPLRQFAVDGGLMSYSGDLKEISRRVGVQYIGSILKGTKPADLPVQQPTKFEWSSTSKPPRHSASPYRPSCSRLPTR
jgi:putative ABC transport system substrate-binding protein